MTVIIGVVAALLALLPQGQAPHPGQSEIRVAKNVPARMRDGVVLRADVYRPSAPGRYPALLQPTPYSKNDRGAPGLEPRDPKAISRRASLHARHFVGSRRSTAPAPTRSGRPDPQLASVLAAGRPSQSHPSRLLLPVVPAR